MARVSAGPLASALLLLCLALRPAIAAPSLPAASSELLRDRPTALAWLEAYARHQYERDPLGNSSDPDPAVVQRRYGAAAAAALADACSPTRASPPGRALLVSPVGDSWDAAAWLDRPDIATFDVLAIYYGNIAGYACERCVATVHRKGPKYRLFADLLADDTFVASFAPPGGYDYIMFPDDDLLKLDTCAINKVLAVARALDLLIAQPAVCEEEGSFTTAGLAYAQPDYLLRFSNFAEIMAPALRWDLWSNVLRWSLAHTHTGWGLDWTMPFILGYPKNRVAIVDAVCMRHPPSPPNKPNSVYAAGAPYGPGEEERFLDAGIGYAAESVAALGERFKDARWYYGVRRNGGAADGAAQPNGQSQASLAAGVPGQASQGWAPLVLGCVLLASAAWAAKQRASAGGLWGRQLSGGFLRLPQ